MKIILVVLFGLLLVLFFGSVLVSGLKLFHRMLSRASPGLASILVTLLSVAAAYVAFRLALAMWPHGHRHGPHFV